MHHRLGHLIIALASSVAPACNRETPVAPPSEAPAKAGLDDHDPVLAHRLVSEGALLLDVRTPSEYADRHLQGAVNVPVDNLQSRSEDLAKLTGGDKKKAIVVYCAAGRRAARAKKLLLDEGYERVTNLGGIDDWDSR